MIYLYNFLFSLAIPLVILRLLWRSRKHPAYGRRIGERLGVPNAFPRADLWVHAVSVGEVQAAAPLIRHFRSRFPERRILVTTTTPTGADRVEALFEQAVEHRYTPLDTAGIMNRVLHRMQPRLVVILETEIWPNLLRACARRRIPVVLINGRLSARSARRYGWLGGFTRETLAHFSAIAAQTEEDAERFRALGAPPDRIQVTGSLKFDSHRPPSLQEQAEALRHTWGCDRPVWIAASTHEGEEIPILEAHRRVLRSLPDALLILVPRHPERFDSVAALAGRLGFPPVRRSSGRACGPRDALFLGDTMGELPIFLGAADVAFFGGSLVPVGGHNLLEAAAAGVPILTGPHMENFAQITALLVQAKAAEQIEDAEALARTLVEWLGDAALRVQMGERGRRVLEQNRGALDRLIPLLTTFYQ